MVFLWTCVSEQIFVFKLAPRVNDSPPAKPERKEILSLRCTYTSLPYSCSHLASQRCPSCSSFQGAPSQPYLRRHPLLHRPPLLRRHPCPYPCPSSVSAPCNPRRRRRRSAWISRGPSSRKGFRGRGRNWLSLDRHSCPSHRRRCRLISSAAVEHNIGVCRYLRVQAAKSSGQEGRHAG